VTGATADRPSTSEDRAATIALTVILGLTGAVLSFGVLLQQTGVAACSGSAAACDYALLAATTWITPTVALAALVLSVVVLARRWRTRRRTWWVPVAGMLAAFAAFAVASLVAAALQDTPR
jgi:uncharacterized membrane protein YhaH (DUF805 family)